MRVLITGNEGFVGRHFREHFLQGGHEVHGCDIVNGLDCRETFRRDDLVGRFDLVVHCAAVVGGRQTIEGEPLRLAAEDLSIDAEMFRWALRAKPRRIVYFSSAAAYGTHHQALTSCVDLNEREHMGGAPDQSYGTVKRVGEHLARMANEARIPVSVFRPFSGYGEDQPLDYPFPSILQRIARREDPLIIWSDTIRDFVHIDDIVGCVLTMINKPVIGPVNICTGRGVSFVELARMAAAQAGYSPTIEVATDKPRGVHRRVGDAQRMLDHYRPTVPLEAGIRRALNALEAR